MRIIINKDFNKENDLFKVAMIHIILLLNFVSKLFCLSKEKSFTDILFIDNNHGWVKTNYDTLLRTTNGGETWAEKFLL